MLSIFFDLETSTTNFIGQILNYSFIVVDDNFQIVDELSKNILISPLELPEPLAILANRTDVIKHQKQNPPCEKESMKQIYDFITKIIKENLKENKLTPIIGYNSSKFDIPYLRTSMIRNGLNPYFNGNLIYKDLLFLARKLSCTNKEFIRTSGKEEKNKLSLTLENNCQNYGVILGKQTHFSRDDVILTINLAKKFKEIFNVDIRTFNAYEFSFSEQIEIKKQNLIVPVIFPEYDLSKDTNYETKYYVLLDFNAKNSLWIDLEEFINQKEAEDGDIKKSIKWFNSQSSYLFKGDSEQKTDEMLEKVKGEALGDLKEVNLENYFTKSECDIEQDIYRIPINLLELLYKSIWENDKDSLKKAKNKELNIVLSRFKLSNINWADNKNKDYEKYLEMYATYRYGEGNRLLLNKFMTKENAKKEDFHKSYNELLKEIKELKTDKKNNKEDVFLLNSLKKFYKNSYITKFLN